MRLILILFLAFVLACSDEPTKKERSNKAAETIEVQPITESTGEVIGDGSGGDMVDQDQEADGSSDGIADILPSGDTGPDNGNGDASGGDGGIDESDEPDMDLPPTVDPDEHLIWSAYEEKPLRYPLTGIPVVKEYVEQTNQSFTLMFWINRNQSVLKKASLVEKWSQFGHDYPYTCRYSEGKVLCATYDASEKRTVVLKSKEQIEKAKWVHVAYTRHQRLFSLFIDGVLQASAEADVGSLENNDPITLGGRIIDEKYSYFFDGTLTAFRLFDAALSADQIAEFADHSQRYDDGTKEN